MRHRRSYGRLSWPLLVALGKTPDQVVPADVLGWAHGIGASGRPPSSSATTGARIACLSSCRFLSRMGLVTRNPCDAVEPPRTVPSIPRGLDAAQVRRLLAVVSDTVAGRRDRAILLTFILTGRRRSEVIGLRPGDFSVERDVVRFTYRGKAASAGAGSSRDLPTRPFGKLGKLFLGPVTGEPVFGGG